MQPTLQSIEPTSRQRARALVRWAKKSWTRELLALVAESLTGIRVSVCVMGRVLRKLRARRGKLKPVVRCPLSKRQQRRRLARIRRRIAELAKRYANAKRIHVILDNYGIHSRHETCRALRQLGRIQLHFLPPYSPDHNRIERFTPRRRTHAPVPRLKNQPHPRSAVLDLGSVI